MLSQEEHVEVMALAGRGWTISAIARHTGLNWRTVRAYVRDGRQPGQRRATRLDAFARYEDYVRIRLRDDPHVWATVLYDEVLKLGFERSYQRFTAELRRRSLRPVCVDCAGARSRGPALAAGAPRADRAQTAHPELPGEGHIALLEAELADLVVHRRPPDVRVIAEPDADVLDEGCEQVRPGRLALTQASPVAEVGLDGVPADADVAGDGRVGPTPLPECRDFHVLLLRQHVLGLLV